MITGYNILDRLAFLESINHEGQQMKKLIIFLCVILNSLLLFQKHSYSQNYFSGQWINSDYYKKLLAGQTPYEATSKKATITALSFIDGDNDLIIVYNFHEAPRFKYRVLSNTRIELPDSNRNMQITIKGTKDDVQLLLINNTDTTYFTNYYQKSSSMQIPDELINKLWFEGKYRLQDGNDYLKFYQDGRLEGFKQYNKYKVACDFQGPPGYDYIMLYSGKETNEFNIYSWKCVDDTLILNYIDIDNKFNFIKSSDSILLIRIE